MSAYDHFFYPLCIRIIYAGDDVLKYFSGFEKVLFQGLYLEVKDRFEYLRVFNIVQHGQGKVESPEICGYLFVQNIVRAFFRPRLPEQIGKKGQVGKKFQWDIAQIETYAQIHNIIREIFICVKTRSVQIDQIRYREYYFPVYISDLKLRYFFEVLFLIFGFLLFFEPRSFIYQFFCLIFRESIFVILKLCLFFSGLFC